MKRIIGGVSILLLSVALCFGSAIPALAAGSTDSIASEGDYGGRTEVGSSGMKAVEGAEVADGTYDMSVETDTSMFNIIDCQLTVKDGKMSAVLTLSGNGYQWLYNGTAEEAAADNEANYIEYVKNDSGRYTYTIDDVPVLNNTVKVSAFSKKNQKWYDHDIIYLAATLPDSALSDTAKQAVKESTPVYGLADGDYTIGVDMTGGSGKASITSPATMHMKDGEATVDIEWSSNNYDYMLVDGVKYEPVNTSGNSVFQIPLRVFDTTWAVIADTTAMSEPHEIEYYLSFHSGQIEAVGGQASTNTASQESSGTNATLIIVIAVLVVVVAALAALLVTRERKRKAVVAGPKGAVHADESVVAQASAHVDDSKNVGLPDKHSEDERAAAWHEANPDKRIDLDDEGSK